MIPNLSRPGRSFRGAAKYFFHDKAADPNMPGHLKPKSDDRVTFYAVRNCASDDPEEAIDEMWHTADMQQRLKREAGVQAGGRRCDNPCQTISLSWHPEQKPSHDHMIETADTYLRVMGWHEHQAVYVGHNDTPHQHIHIILNRVHPETGRTLNDRSNWTRAQEWAAEFELAEGKIYCEKRFDPANENGHTVPRNVFEQSRPFEKAFNAHEAARIQASELDLLREAQKAERLAFVEESKKLYRAARHEAFAEVRDAYKEHWRAFYENRDQVWQDFDARKEVVNEQARSCLKNGDVAGARRIIDDHAHDFVTLTNVLQAEHDTIKQACKAATQQAQKEACDTLRLMRDEQYKVLLERQQRERDEIRRAEAETVKDQGPDRQPSGVEQIWKARAANQNIDLRAPEPPQPANANAPPGGEQARANGAARDAGAPQADVRDPETARHGAVGHDPSSTRGAATHQTVGDHTSWGDDAPFVVKQPHLRSRSGRTLGDIHETLETIPATNAREVFTIGLAMHHEWRGAEPAYVVFAHWAEQNPLFRDGRVADLWHNAPDVYHQPFTLKEIDDIARHYAESVPTLVSEPDPGYSSERLGANAPDMAAGAIGAAANYVADQLGEFFAPSSPAELAVRGRQAEIAAEIAAERKIVMDDLFVKYANQAIRRTEDERVQQERDDEYWQSRERQRDR